MLTAHRVRDAVDCRWPLLIHPALYCPQLEAAKQQQERMLSQVTALQADVATLTDSQSELQQQLGA